ncbi:hypothetical protein, partial [Salmonella enterica]|uniref:hypothetical protein n=1 Tax=Salmonella enterica TaxID=28901 RepID=UPI00288CE45B
MTEYKGFKIVSDGTMGYWLIKQPGSGATPSALSGLYTTPAIAKNAIDAYEPKRGAKKKDGEA